MLNKLYINNKAVPFIILFLLVASFGLLIPKLGFYWDDWPVIFMTETQGSTGFWDFYQYDRPFSAWTYLLSAPILGTSPIGWHIYSLLLRWLTVVFLWLTLQKIWPSKPRQTFWIALLFSVYPIFNQQPVAVAYSQHWTSYLFYFVSIYLMLFSQKGRRFYYPWVLLSAFFSLIHMVTMEYFIGLELFRPIILWTYHYNYENISNKLVIFKKTLFSSWPYLVLLGIYVIWRLFFLNLADNDPNDPVFLKQITEAPVQALLDLLQIALQDLIYFLSSWFVGINPTIVDLRRPFFIVSTGISLITVVLLGLVLSRYKPIFQASISKRWHLQAVLFGITAALFGTLPVWMIGRQASLGLYGNRFGLAAMFGLSVALVGFLEWLSNRISVKITVICFLIGIAIHSHLYTAKSYVDSWEKQQRVYWQLSWRAPHIQPGTAIISDGEIFRYVGIYSTAMGFALLYPPTEDPQDMAYWFFSMGRGLNNMTEEMISGVPLTGSLRNYFFEGESKDALLLYLPGKNRCVRILRVNDPNTKEIPNLLKQVISISNLDRIKKDAHRDWSPPENIFGKEPEHSWCYYFESAELARQYQDWDEVIQLYQVAEQQEYSPSEMIEYLPLIDALLHTDRIEEAYQLSSQIKRLSDKIDDPICRVWLNNIENQNNTEIIYTYEKINKLLNCFD